MKTIVENGSALEVSAMQKKTDFGIAYWQARYSFPTGAGTARMHGVTIGFYASEGDAEGAALHQARRDGWGNGPSC